MARPSPEFRLMAACCVWPPGERRIALVKQAAAEVRDWERLVRLVHRHRVAALVDDGLKRAMVDLPAPCAAAIRQSAARSALRSLQLAAESIRVRDVLAKAGVPCVFLKGATVAALAFGRLDIKASWDVDVLIAPDAFARADAALEAAGYRRHDPPRDFDERRMAVWLTHYKEAVYVGGPSGAAIELHWRLVDHARLLPGLSANAPLRDIDIGGTALPTFEDEDLFAYLCVHGAHHGWARLKWLVDVAALLAQRREAEIEALYEACAQRGAERCAGQALLLCERLLGLQLPDRLGRELRRGWPTRLLERLGLATLLVEGELNASPWAKLKMRASHLLLGRGFSHLLAEWRVKWTGRQDRLDIALPPQLDFLYSLIRIPLWLWRRLPRGSNG